MAIDYEVGDWVVWSGFRDEQSDDFRRNSGEGPFLVKEVDKSIDCIRIADPYHKVIGLYAGGRFKKANRFLVAVKQALAEADRG